ncbi:hypothetical protein Mal4_32870 [Maioricimonas rarisocia]|uniref:Cytidyltransferase-like domain-containing protein n=1 Tax=Maioricimonas rarisocia TaxID=2528026 RepID=A0A517Z905_9PLAN|nr:hypothetical protein [Maioricimonas rarisocia]QDU38955.1 hypothetical protein Mal4_32870 [Maioricimonas rarisocia]
MSHSYRSFVVVAQDTEGTPVRPDSQRPDQLIELKTSADLTDWIGSDVTSLTAAETAAHLSTRAWQRSPANSSTTDRNWAGVGCRVVEITAARLGAVVVHTHERTDLLQWSLPLDEASRFHAATSQLLDSVLERLARGQHPDSAVLREVIPGLSHRWAGASAEIRELLAGNIGVVWRQPRGELTLTRPADVGAVLSGAFNPLHEGHAALRHAAADYLGVETAYELPIVNADKPPIDFLSLEQRTAQFTDAPLALSRAATFAEKASFLPGMTFVVGFDTAIRILEPRYYGGPDAMLHVLRQFGDAGGSFLVAGRLCGGEFQTCSDLPRPAPVRDLFEELPASRFRMDVSSTEVRRQR